MLSILFSCTSTETIKGKTKAETLFKQAQSLIEKKRFLSATERLNVLRSQHPYSFYATPAELLLADIRYKQKDYIEAAASYIAFRDLHPKHKRMDYIIGRIADSYYKQMPSTFDRDLTATKQAISYYGELLRKYPKSSYSENAVKRMNEAQEMIENKEKYIADFYFKTKNYEAAKYRYKEILSRFKRPQLVDHATVRIAQSLMNMKEYKQCISHLKNYAKRLTEEAAKEALEIVDDCGEKMKDELASN